MAEHTTLTEAIATLCSINEGLTGHLQLTQAGNFHTQTKQPPLWVNADHVIDDQDRQIIIKDLRCTK